MIIAVNARFLVEPLEGIGNFSYETMRLIVKEHPEHQFHFLFDRPYNDRFIFDSNVHPHIISPPARHPILWKLWFDWKVPAVLKKLGADVFISPDGFCSLRTKVPQCMVVHDLGFLHFPGAYKTTHAFFYKRYMPEYLKKAHSIAVVSEFTRNDILAHYKVAPEKIDIVYSAAKQIFRATDLQDRTAVKEKYTGGHEFFIYTGAIQPRKNLLNLLKAFSIFKRRLQSSMKLVLVGRLAWKNQEFSELIATYKYREDVILTGYIPEEEVAALTAASYALVYPSLFEGFGVPVLEGMKSGVPVLTSKNSSMEEIAGEAAIYFDPEDVASIADKLMMIYKDESLRGRLVEKGRAVADQYTWERTAQLLWSSLIKAAGNHGNR